MDIKIFDQKKDIREIIRLAIRASEENQTDILLHCQICNRCLADIVQICTAKGQMHSDLFKQIQQYYLRFDEQKDLQSILLTLSGVPQVYRNSFLHDSMEEYVKKLNTMQNADQVERANNLSLSSNPNEISEYFRRGELGLNTLVSSFKGWLAYKIKGNK